LGDIKEEEKEKKLWKKLEDPIAHNHTLELLRKQYLGFEPKLRELDKAKKKIKDLEKRLRETEQIIEFNNECIDDLESNNKRLIDQKELLRGKINSLIIENERLQRYVDYRAISFRDSQNLREQESDDLNPEFEFTPQPIPEPVSEKKINITLELQKEINQLKLAMKKKSQTFYALKKEKRAFKLKLKKKKEQLETLRKENERMKSQLSEKDKIVRAIRKENTELSQENHIKKDFKILVGGAAGVGRTALLKHFIEGKKLDLGSQTIGIEFFAKEMHYEGHEIRSIFYDFAGQQRFRFFQRDLVKGASCGIVGFDLNLIRMDTFNKMREWINLFRIFSNNLPLLIVGFKLDLKEAGTPSEEMIQDLLEDPNLVGYVECSSKSGVNVDKVFNTLAEILLVQKLLKKRKIYTRPQYIISGHKNLYKSYCEKFLNLFYS